ncbi:hypothetical protein KST06_02170 [Fusobacterium nucleatum]
MKRRIMDIKKFKKIFKRLIFFNIIISIFFLFGYNVIELEKIDILPDITYILFHFFIILLSIYSNIFMYNALLKDNHKKLFFWYFIFSLILIFCCYLVYDLNMGINISYIIRKIGDLSVFESIKIILKDFLNIWKYHIIFFLEFFIPIKYFYLIRKEKKD